MRPFPVLRLHSSCSLPMSRSRWPLKCRPVGSSCRAAARRATRQLFSAPGFLPHCGHPPPHCGLRHPHGSVDAAGWLEQQVRWRRQWRVGRLDCLWRHGHATVARLCHGRIRCGSPGKSPRRHVSRRPSRKARSTLATAPLTKPLSPPRPSSVLTTETPPSARCMPAAPPADASD